MKARWNVTLPPATLNVPVAAAGVSKSRRESWKSGPNQERKSEDMGKLQMVYKHAISTVALTEELYET